MAWSTPGRNAGRTFIGDTSRDLPVWARDDFKGFKAGDKNPYFTIGNRRDRGTSDDRSGGTYRLRREDVGIDLARKESADPIYRRLYTMVSKSDLPEGSRGVVDLRGGNESRSESASVTDLKNPGDLDNYAFYDANMVSGEGVKPGAQDILSSSMLTEEQAKWLNNQVATMNQDRGNVAKALADYTKRRQRGQKRLSELEAARQTQDGAQQAQQGRLGNRRGTILSQANRSSDVTGSAKTLLGG